MPLRHDTSDTVIGFIVIMALLLSVGLCLLFPMMFWIFLILIACCFAPNGFIAGLVAGFLATSIVRRHR